ncbi:hypothetical protein FQR65_LT10656 [Abscondita terminalis]|nr:hypothetical protein FQR65_LT10656 [Abscondita terminalis]
MGLMVVLFLAIREGHLEFISSTKLLDDEVRQGRSSTSFIDLKKSTTSESLSEILKDWAFNIQEMVGAEYNKGAVETIWNITAKMVQQIDFKKFNRTINPFKDVVFQTAIVANPRQI